MAVLKMIEKLWDINKSKNHNQLLYLIYDIRYIHQDIWANTWYMLYSTTTKSYTSRSLLCLKFISLFLTLLPAPDSDATTVPAKTPEAKKHAAAGFAAAKGAAEKQAEPATPNPPSKPSLKREVQSKEVLAETAPDVPEVTEPQGKRLRRMEGHELKQGSSTEEMQPQKNQQHGPPTATAVKAKAAPTVKVETKAPHEPQAQAVAECLQRSSTQDMEVAAAQATQGKQKVAEKKVSGASDPPPPPNPDDHESDSSESDSEERRKKAALIKAKKEAHARYMRFHRSLTSTSEQLFWGESWKWLNVTVVNGNVFSSICWG